MGLLILIFFALAVVVVLIASIVTHKISTYLPVNSFRWLWQALIFLFSTGILGMLVLLLLSNSLRFEN